MIKNETIVEPNKVKSMQGYLAPAVREMKPSGIRKFFDLVSNSKDDIISLGVGEPDFSTPGHVREAAVYSLERGRTKYTPNSGIPELREAIADYLYNSFKVKYEPSNEVLVTVGGSEAIDLALRAFIAPGDEILIPEPCYISYSPITALTGGKPVGIETFAKDEFKLKAEALQAVITPKSKVLILCYPSNPTGGTMTYEDYLPIAKLVE